MITVYKNIKIDDFILNPILKKRDQLLAGQTERLTFCQKFGLVENNRKKIEDWFYKNTGKKIKTFSSWINFVTYSTIDNGYEWHEDRYDTRLGHTKEQNDLKLLEKPMLGNYTSVVWIDGKSNNGGSLSVMTDEGIEVINFEKNTIITFPMDCYHRIEKYNSDDYRISMNFTFDYV
jgi:hypothetical protein